MSCSTMYFLIRRRAEIWISGISQKLQCPNHFQHHYRKGRYRAIVGASNEEERCIFVCACHISNFQEALCTPNECVILIQWKRENIEVVYSPKINQWTDILLTKFKVVIWLSQSFVIRWEDKRVLKNYCAFHMRGSYKPTILTKKHLDGGYMRAKSPQHPRI